MEHFIMTTNLEKKIVKIVIYVIQKYATHYQNK